MNDISHLTRHNSLSAGLVKAAAIAPIAASLLCAGASASAASLVPANFYDCEGRETTVRFSPNRGGSGEPSIVITLGKKVIRANGQEILSQQTVLGSLVTVRYASDPDSHTDTLTLLAPDVNLPAIPNKRPVEFMTPLFSTRTFTTIGGPSLVPGLSSCRSSCSQAARCSATSGRRRAGCASSTRSTSRSWARPSRRPTSR